MKKYILVILFISAISACGGGSSGVVEPINEPINEVGTYSYSPDSPAPLFTYTSAISDIAISIQDPIVSVQSHVADSLPITSKAFKDKIEFYVGDLTFVVSEQKIVSYSIDGEFLSEIQHEGIPEVDEWLEFMSQSASPSAIPLSMSQRSASSSIDPSYLNVSVVYKDKFNELEPVLFAAPKAELIVGNGSRIPIEMVMVGGDSDIYRSKRPLVSDGTNITDEQIRLGLQASLGSQCKGDNHARNVIAWAVMEAVAKTIEVSLGPLLGDFLAKGSKKITKAAMQSAFNDFTSETANLNQLMCFEGIQKLTESAVNIITKELDKFETATVLIYPEEGYFLGECQSTFYFREPSRNSLLQCTLKGFTHPSVGFYINESELDSALEARELYTIGFEIKNYQEYFESLQKTYDEQSASFDKTVSQMELLIEGTDKFREILKEFITEFSENGPAATYETTIPGGDLNVVDDISASLITKVPQEDGSIKYITTQIGEKATFSETASFPQHHCSQFGLISPVNVSFTEAVDFCATYGAKLPSFADFSMVAPDPLSASEDTCGWPRGLYWVSDASNSPTMSMAHHSGINIGSGPYHSDGYGNVVCLKGTGYSRKNQSNPSP